jgi:hypothetical protein
MEPSKMPQLKHLRDENINLKRLVADLSLDKACCKTSCKTSSEAHQEAGDGESGPPLRWGYTAHRTTIGAVGTR